jgi:hypothetical protein
MPCRRQRPSPSAGSSREPRQPWKACAGPKASTHLKTFSMNIMYYVLGQLTLTIHYKISMKIKDDY